MKKIIFLLFIASSLVTAQKKEVVYKKLANLSCECVTAKGDVKITELELGLCLYEALGNLTEKEAKTVGYNPDKKLASVEKIAENVGIEMAFICPKVFNNIEGYESETVEEVTAVAFDDEVIQSSYKGTFELIKAQEFNTIIIIDESNSPRSFIWLYPFEGDKLFINNKIVKGDKIEVFYTEQKYYDAASKTYKIFNEITKVNLL
jgi:hypothetical protein